MINLKASGDCHRGSLQRRFLHRLFSDPRTLLFNPAKANINVIGHFFGGTMDKMVNTSTQS
jgi:hypothetical protein